MIKRILPILIAILLCASPVTATDVYIDPTAGSGGDGSCANPYDSWADVSGNFVQGHDYYQKVGTTETLSALINVTTSGTSDDDIIIGAYSKSGEVCTDNVTTGTRPIIKRGAVPDSGTAFVVDAAYIYFSYLEIQNSTRAFKVSDGAATSNNHWDRVNVTSGNISGIDFRGTYSCSDHIIQDCLFDTDQAGGSGSNGIQNWECDNIQILNNTFDGFEHTLIEFKYGANNSIIRGNLFTNDENRTSHAFSFNDGSSGNLFEYNWIENTGGIDKITNTTDGDDAGDPCENGCTTENNVIKNNVWNGSYGLGPTEEFLIVSAHGDDDAGTVQNNKIYNNTFYNSGAGILQIGTGAQSVDGTCTGNEFKNNIAYGYGNSNDVHVYAGGTNPTVTNNTFANCIFYDGGSSIDINHLGNDYSTVAAWQSGESDVSNMRAEADPNFTSNGTDFTLQSGSDAIDNGVDLGDTYDDAIDPDENLSSNFGQNQDIATMDQDPDWEIGAYGYESSDTPSSHCRSIPIPLILERRDR